MKSLATKLNPNPSQSICELLWYQSSIRQVGQVAELPENNSAFSSPRPPFKKAFSLSQTSARKVGELSGWDRENDVKPSSTPSKVTFSSFVNMPCWRVNSYPPGRISSLRSSKAAIVDFTSATIFCEIVGTQGAGQQSTWVCSNISAFFRAYFRHL